MRSASWWWGKSRKFSNGEPSEEVDTGGPKDVGEGPWSFGPRTKGFDPFPVAALEKGVGLETHLLTGEIARQLVAIVGQTAETLPEVVRDVGEGQLVEAQAGCDVIGIVFIVLPSAEIQALFELGDELGIEANQLGCEGLQEGVGGQEAMEGKPQ